MTLQALIDVKVECEKNLAVISAELEIYKAEMAKTRKGFSSELETLEKNKNEAVQALAQAKDVLVNYQPTTAREHSLQALAIIDSILKDVR